MVPTVLQPRYKGATYLPMEYVNRYVGRLSRNLRTGVLNNANRAVMHTK